MRDLKLMSKVGIKDNEISSMVHDDGIKLYSAPVFLQIAR
jgi:hypothetical protein